MQQQQLLGFVLCGFHHCIPEARQDPKWAKAKKYARGVILANYMNARGSPTKPKPKHRPKNHSQAIIVSNSMKAQGSP